MNFPLRSGFDWFTPGILFGNAVYLSINLTALARNTRTANHLPQADLPFVLLTEALLLHGCLHRPI
jgi:hypothetical protein